MVLVVVLVVVVLLAGVSISAASKIPLGLFFKFQTYMLQAVPKQRIQTSRSGECGQYDSMI